MGGWLKCVKCDAVSTEPGPRDHHTNYIFVNIFSTAVKKLEAQFIHHSNKTMSMCWTSDYILLSFKSGKVNFFMRYFKAFKHTFTSTWWCVKEHQVYMTIKHPLNAPQSILLVDVSVCVTVKQYFTLHSLGIKLFATAINIPIRYLTPEYFVARNFGQL